MSAIAIWGLVGAIFFLGSCIESGCRKIADAISELQKYDEES